MAIPTTEIGHGGLSPLQWAEMADQVEDVPDLMWPFNIPVYNKMRNDAQVSAMLLAQTLPILRYKWALDPNDARDEVVEWVSKNVNLPIVGDQKKRAKGRQRGRFSHENHLRQALLCLPYGGMYFEQVGRWENENEKGVVPRGMDPGLRELKKLAPRMPLTIQKISVATDGGLESITQWPSGRSIYDGSRITSAFMQAKPIPVKQLVAYIHQQEGGDWYGRSVLRACYKNWLVKDRLIRVDAMKHERNGVGIPIVEAPPNTNPTEMKVLAALAQQYRSGEAAGGAVPNGARLRLVGVEGSTPDTIASVRYHDEQIVKSTLSSFLDLGTTSTGSRALGESFIDFFSMSQEAIANEYRDVFNAHVIEDLVDWNFGTDEPAPLLTYERNEDATASVVDLVALVNAGLIDETPEVKAYILDRYKLPESPDVDPDEQDPDSLVPVAPKLVPVAAASKSRRQRIVVKAAAGDPEPPEVGYRDPFDHEIDAGTNFTALDAAYTAALAALLARWGVAVKPAMIADLVAQIEAIDPTDEVALANIAADPIGADVIEQAMTAFVATSIAAALDEAAYQGAQLDPPDTAEIEAEIAATAEALAIIMAKSMSEAASRNATSQVGAGLTAAGIAAVVAAALADLTDAYLKDQFMGALSVAQNSGRLAVFSQGVVEKVWASELLDRSTCRPCLDIDGKEYATLEDGMRDYPRGYNSGCKGRSRCRGLLLTRLEPSESA